MYHNNIKRTLSILLSFGGLIIFWWLFLIIIIAIKLDSPGPVIFKQKRVGLNKRYFDILKFRTMRIDTPPDVPTHLMETPDQYITRVGRFLRRTSLDELPQLINILKGDMSVIGPRPALWNQYDLIEERDKYGANDVRPGLTGWAQINGRDELPIEKKAELDGYYVKHMGVLMDLRCFFGTITYVFNRRGIVEGGTGAMYEAGSYTRKIMVITNHSYMLWRFRRELIEELMKENEVVLSMPFVGHEDDFQKMGLRCIETDVDRRGINPKTDFRLLRTYYRMLKEEKPDMVITYSIKPNIYAGLSCCIQNIPFHANVQGLGAAFQRPVLAWFVTMLYKIAFCKVETVFFENEANAAEFRKRHIVPKEKEVVLSGAGINLEDYALKPYPNNKTVHFLYLGRLMKEKGIDELFEVVQRLRAEKAECVLDLVGFFEDEYKEQVKKLQQNGSVVFHGFQQEPRPYYEMADCVVLPSHHEGMSNVLLEAAAIGRPIITNDIPGCRETVSDGETGILVKKKDVESLYQAMKNFMNMSTAERETMGIAGRRKMEREFRKEKVVAETMNALGLAE